MTAPLRKPLPFSLDPVSFGIFDGIDPTAAAEALAKFPRQDFSAGDVVLREGATNNAVLFIESGELAVWKGAPENASGIHLRTMRAGDCFGEMSAFHHTPVSTTVIALTPAVVRTVKPEIIAEAGMREQVTRNIMRTLTERLNSVTNEILAHHEARNRALQVQLSSSVFVTQMLVVLSVYMLCLPLFDWLRPRLPSDSLISIPVIVAVAIVAWFFLTQASTGVAEYGFTLREWRKQVAASLRVTLPLLAAATLAKWMAVIAWPHTMAVFEPWRVIGQKGEPPGVAWLLLVVAYAALSFAQEFVRCTVQGSLAIYYRSSGHLDRWQSLLVANIVFSATHVHLGGIFPWIAFCPGLLWGWMYQRNHSFLGAALSHALTGSWVLFVLGVPK